MFFDDTATTPTGLVGLGVTLFYGLRPGHATSCSDAVQAYLQALIGDGTRVVIPPELWLPEWHDMYPSGTKLVVRLLKSLYGHPESGRRWQQFLERHLRELGGTECPEYPSNCIFNLNGKTLILNIYVDDLTLSGPAELHQQFWHSLRARVKLDPEVYVESGDKGCRILGRHHSFFRDPSQGVNPATCEFDMRSYASQLVDFYCEVAGVTKDKLRNFPSPCYPENQLTDADLDAEGELHHVASRILMRGLWLSRLARPDLSFAITRLASRVTKWTRFEDRQLLQCISYLHHTNHLTLRGAVSQTDLACSIEVFTDADFASCPYTAKSTTGIIIRLRTGDSHFPVHWLSKKQSSTARSTTEAEMIALATAMFSEVENLQAFLEVLLDAEVPVSYQQDNETVLAILKVGCSAKLRHMNRVHRVNVASVCERLAEDRVQASYCSTKLQRANGFTKVISPQEWPLVLSQLCLLPATGEALAHPARLFSADALVLADPRAAAGILPRRLEAQHILHLLSLLPHDGASRAVETTDTHCFSVGAYAHGGGIVGIRKNTHLFPEVAKALTRFVRQQQRNHTFTSVALFSGQQAEVHSDKWNEPNSYNLVLPITQVVGGEIWVADPDLEDLKTSARSSAVTYLVTFYLSQRCLNLRVNTAPSHGRDLWQSVLCLSLTRLAVGASCPSKTNSF